MINKLISVQFIHSKSRINKFNIYEIFALLGVDTVFVGCCFPSFPDSLIFSSLRIKQFHKHAGKRWRHGGFLVMANGVNADWFSQLHIYETFVDASREELLLTSHIGPSVHFSTHTYQRSAHRRNFVKSDTCGLRKYGCNRKIISGTSHEDLRQFILCAAVRNILYPKTTHRNPLLLFRGKTQRYHAADGYI